MYNFDFCFKSIVKKYSDKIALIDVDDTKYTYKRLDYLSTKIANFLNNQLPKEKIIAIDSKKNYKTILGFLGALKSQKTYFFLDLNQPQKRILEIFKKTKANYLITESKIKFLNITSISIEKIFENNKKNNLLSINYSDNKFAYVMFTSGSTGEPKGAIISHENILNFVKWSKKNFLINSKDVFSQVNPLYFDNSVFDLYNCFLNGSTLVLTNGLDISDPKKLLKTLKKHKCTIWFSTPSLLIYFINIGLAKKSYFSFFKKIIFGGEGFPKSKLSYLIEKIGNKKKYFNVYGPTECTCICSSYLVKQSDFFDKENMYVPIGKIANIFSYNILEPRNEETSGDKVGELILSGPNVGYGYINDYQNTKKNFIFYNKTNGLRKYKTGDIVKYSKKRDLLYFIGREDSQIKHMGYRLELNELEIVINRMALVKEACVFYLKKTQNDFGKIVAIISSSKKIKDLDVIKHIKNFLPSYFLPNELIFCKDLKKNANGKIDRSYIKKFYEKRITY